MNPKQRLIHHWNWAFRLTKIRLVDPIEKDYQPGLPFYSSETISYAFEYAGAVYLVAVGPAYTDMASIPRLLWAIVHPLQLDPRAVVVHDEVVKAEGKFRIGKSVRMFRVRSTVDWADEELWTKPFEEVWLPINADWTRAETDAFFFLVMREAMEKRWKIPDGKDPEKVRRRWRIRRRWAYRGVRLWVRLKKLLGDRSF